MKGLHHMADTFFAGGWIVMLIGFIAGWIGYQRRIAFWKTALFAAAVGVLIGRFFAYIRDHS